uniref:Intermembrane lipid transfer protein VPS13-like C-terminal domain-containing protein n=4 Tax=Cucumis sativus TaxID=3659 RepID=A0A0A0LY06_CUCSA
MGFARRLGIGIRDFLSVPAKTILQSPTGLITGMVQGTTSLLSNTVYAFSDATTQFSKAARKGIVAFTFDDQAFSRIGQQQTGVSLNSGGVISEVLEGLTGLLQSPIRGAERHGLPGVFSGIALGITGLVAKPAASVLELTGKTAQSIRNRSRLYQMRPQRLRVRLPRPLSTMLPLRPYSWEEAIGSSVLLEAGGDDMKLSDEVLVACKALKLAGKFVVITQSLILIVSCASLVDLGKPEFRGIAADSKWVIESAIGLDTVIHADTNNDGTAVHIVGSSSDLLSRPNKSLQKRVIGRSSRAVRWTGPTPLPIFETILELELKEDAENLLKTLLSAIELAKDWGWHRGRHVLHRYDVK